MSLTPQTKESKFNKLSEAGTASFCLGFENPETLRIFLEYLRRIGKRPGLFKVKKVEDIYLQFQDLHLVNQAVERFLAGFRSYVQNSLNVEINNRTTWSDDIRAYSTDDEHTLRIFFGLMEEFLMESKLI